MSKKNKTATTEPAVTKTSELVATEEIPTAKEPESIVDEVFDTVTAWAAKGLAVAKRGLEASARWLDGRAKTVGDLASKLGAA
jgi:hypothetical protein